MKILFVTAVFELGKDGVADYTHLLAKECQRLGHTCSVIAINDKFVEGESVQTCVDGNLVLRIASSLDNQGKRGVARAFYKKINPEWVSVQMVSYGFNVRGFVFGLGALLRDFISKDAKIQVMFHELWIGMAIEAGLRERVYGVVQKYSMLGFIKKLKPIILHVGNDVYYSALAQEGLNSSYLPVFSNIPVEKQPDFGWVLKELNIPASKRDEYVVLLFFGTIHPLWDVGLVLNKIIGSVVGKNVLFLSVGSQGYGASIWEEAKVKFQNKAKFVKLGFLDTKRISEVISFSDIGLCTNPRSLLGKSGTTMSMIEHGLPVIITREDYQYKFELTNVEIEFPNIFDWHSFDARLIVSNEGCFGGGLGQVAKKILEELEQCK